jgi:hypothetical protein
VFDGRTAIYFLCNLLFKAKEYTLKSCQALQHQRKIVFF